MSDLSDIRPLRRLLRVLRQTVDRGSLHIHTPVRRIIQPVVEQISSALPPSLKEKELEGLKLTLEACINPVDREKKLALNRR